jgi:hypothetical protein
MDLERQNQPSIVLLRNHLSTCNLFSVIVFNRFIDPQRNISVWSLLPQICMNFDMKSLWEWHKIIILNTNPTGFETWQKCCGAHFRNFWRERHEAKKKFNILTRLQCQDVGGANSLRKSDTSKSTEESFFSMKEVNGNIKKFWNAERRQSLLHIPDNFLWI